SAFVRPCSRRFVSARRAFSSRAFFLRKRLRLMTSPMNTSCHRARSRQSPRPRKFTPTERLPAPHPSFDEFAQGARGDFGEVRARAPGRAYLSARLLLGGFVALLGTLGDD